MTSFTKSENSKIENELGTGPKTQQTNQRAFI